jgi:hypothetical protein
MSDLHNWADVAVIATFILAFLGVFGYLSQLWGRLQRRLKLEAYLEGIANTEKLAQHTESEEQTQKHTAIHIMKNVGLTQDEIIQASFASKRIERFVHVNRDTGAADYLLFRYRDQL